MTPLRQSGPMVPRPLLDSEGFRSHNRTSRWSSAAEPRLLNCKGATMTEDAIDRILEQLKAPEVRVIPLLQASQEPAPRSFSFFLL